MKLAVVLSSVAATVVLALPAGAASPAPGPKNASFEQGLNAWTIDVTSGGEVRIFAGQIRPGGGTQYARLTPESEVTPTAVEQTFDGAAGSKVTGFARFNNIDDTPGPDCFYDDSAQVTIDGTPVFQASSCTTDSTGAVVWTYVLPASGSHTIRGEVVNFDDTAVDSTLDMDAPLLVKLTP
jgi:hypothetical protein